MHDMMTAIEASSTPIVALWINWMVLIFLLSIIFVWRHKTARYVLLAIILTGPIGYLVWSLTGKVHLIGIAHLIVWFPMAVYLYFNEFKQENFKWKSVYGVWLILLVTTIIISLVFDVRDIALVLMGQK